MDEKTREERAAALAICRKVSEIIAHLESCDGKVVLYTWHGLIELTQEVTKFENGNS